MLPSPQQTVTRGVRLVGAGASVPERAVDNARIAAAIPGWTPERIEEKTSILDCPLLSVR